MVVVVIDVHVDAVDCVHGVGEAVEVDVDDVVDVVQAGELLDHLQGQLRAPVGVGGVEPVDPLAGDVDLQVAWDRHHRDLVRRHPQQDRGVRAAELIGGALVRAEDQDRLRVARIGNLELAGHRRQPAQPPGDSLQVDEQADRRRGRHRDDDQQRPGDEAGPKPPPGRHLVIGGRLRFGGGRRLGGRLRLRLGAAEASAGAGAGAVGAVSAGGPTPRAATCSAVRARSPASAASRAASRSARAGVSASWVAWLGAGSGSSSGSSSSASSSSTARRRRALLAPELPSPSTSIAVRRLLLGGAPRSACPGRRRRRLGLVVAGIAQPSPAPEMSPAPPASARGSRVTKSTIACR